jgi:hypothetical protein
MTMMMMIVVIVVVVVVVVIIIIHLNILQQNLYHLVKIIAA